MRSSSDAKINFTSRLLTTIKEHGIPFVIVAIIWEMMTSFGFVPSFFLPTLSSIANSIIYWTFEGTLLNSAVITLFRAISGLSLAITLGFTIGIIMYINKSGRLFFEPLIVFGMSFPVITLIPAFVLWFGFGHVSRILLVALACTFPIAMSTYNGATNVRKEYVWSALVLGTSSKLKLMRKIVIPHSIPFILGGVRVSLHISLIVAFVFEMVAGGGGLGFLEIRAARFFMAPELFASLFTIVIIGFILDHIVQYVQKRLLAWV